MFAGERECRFPCLSTALKQVIQANSRVWNRSSSVGVANHRTRRRDRLRWQRHRLGLGWEHFCELAGISWVPHCRGCRHDTEGDGWRPEKNEAAKDRSQPAARVNPAAQHPQPNACDRQCRDDRHRRAPNNRLAPLHSLEQSVALILRRVNWSHATPANRMSDLCARSKQAPTRLSGRFQRSCKGFSEN
jgi:hypothetical protein